MRNDARPIGEDSTLVPKKHGDVDEGRDVRPAVDTGASGADDGARAETQPRALQAPIPVALQQHVHSAAALIGAPSFHERPTLMELP